MLMSGENSKSLHINIYSASYRGLEHSRIELLQELSAHFDVTVLCDGAGRLNFGTCDIGKLDCQFRPNTFSFFRKLVTTRLRCTQNVASDAVIFNLVVVFVLAVLGVLPKGKLLIVITGLGFFDNYLALRMLKFFLKRKSSDELAFITQNKSDHNTIDQLFTENEVWMIESSGVKPVIKYNRKHIDSKSYVMAYLGRITFRKGILWLLLFHYINGRSNKLIIGGGVDSIGRFILYIAERLGGVRYVGYVDDVNQFFASVDVLIYPARYNDGFPRVILESWGSGTLVVARSTELNRLFLEDGKYGVLSGLFGFKLPDNRSDLQEAARKRVEGLSMASVQREYLRRIKEFFIEQNKLSMSRGESNKRL